MNRWTESDRAQVPARRRSPGHGSAWRCTTRSSPAARQRGHHREGSARRHSARSRCRPCRRARRARRGRPGPPDRARRLPRPSRARVGDNHHHLICRTCGATVDATARSRGPVLQASERPGYEIDGGEVISGGTARCRDPVPPRPRAPPTERLRPEPLPTLPRPRRPDEPRTHRTHDREHGTSGSTTSTSPRHRATAIRSRSGERAILLHDVHFPRPDGALQPGACPERKRPRQGTGAFGTFETTRTCPATPKCLSSRGEHRDARSVLDRRRRAGQSGHVARPTRFALSSTVRGHYDLVGNNTPVSSLRDTMKFPHFIRSQKRRGGIGSARQPHAVDFWSLNPSPRTRSLPHGDRASPGRCAT